MADPIIRVNSRDFLRREMPGRDDLFPFLELNTFDMAVWFDDFMGDQFRYDATAPGTYQTTADSGATAAAIVTGQVNGIIRLVTGTTANQKSDISLGLHFRGELNAVIAVRLLASAVTSVKMEVGFTDVVSGTDDGAVNVLATPSFNATDAALWVVDTNDTALWQAVGVQNGTAATKQEPTSDQVGPAAATYETMIVALRDTTAYFYRLNANGRLTYSSDPMTSAVTAATSLTPWVSAHTRNTTSKNCDIDFIWVAQRRTT